MGTNNLFFQGIIEIRQDPGFSQESRTNRIQDEDQREKRPPDEDDFYIVG